MNSRVYKGGLILAAVLLLWAAARSQRQLNRVREQLGLIRLPVPQNAPPVLAFTTVVLGGFRGLIANALWIRASDLQEEGKYFEMVQLADWITKLQPYFSTVWEHLAWNMAYNISIKFTDPAERWPWVLRGIELLRDEGLQYNPKEPGIYYGLSMLFQHKMGGNLDDAQMYYKNVWAEEMSKVFPSGHPDSELLEPKSEAGRERVRLLREKFKMDPKRVQEVESLYGPLEWRLPDAHAIYWAYTGLQLARKEELMRLRRVIYQSMQLAFTRGRLVVAGNFFELGPNLDIIPRVSASYEEMIREEPTRDDIPRAHRNFLKNAVYFLYTHNRLVEAGKWFAFLHEKYPNAFCAHDPNSPEHRNNCPYLPASQSLDDYAISRIQEDIGETSRDKTKSNLEGLLRQSFLSLAVGESDRATGLQNLAEKIWLRYMQKIKGQEKRVGLPPLNQIREEVLNEMLHPEHGLNQELQNRLRTALNLPAAAEKKTDEKKAE